MSRVPLDDLPDITYLEPADCAKLAASLFVTVAHELERAGLTTRREIGERMNREVSPESDPVDTLLAIIARGLIASQPGPPSLSVVD